MRIETVVVAAVLLATAAVINAAPQWPYRDAVAPYYYGYPGQTPYMYRSGDEDDERDETSFLARQDLKVGNKDAGSAVTVVEDDEKADGIRVVETGSAKPVAQSGNNQQAQDQQLPAPAQQGNQPLSAANNNAASPNQQQSGQQQQQTAGQPLTVQQPGQQPPAFPPARPPQRQRPAEEEDEEDEDEESEEEDEDAEDDEDEGDDDDDDDEEEDDEDRKRNDAVIQKDVSSEDAVVPQQQKNKVVPVQQEEEDSSAAVAGTNESTSDELIPEEPQEVPVPQVVHKQPASQSAVVNNKLNKNKHQTVQPAVVAVAGGKNKKKAVTAPKKVTKNPNTGAIEALVPGYVTDQGEVLVPVDTVTGSQPITIVPDPFSPPSRIVSGPRPIPQRALPSSPSRQVPYWYRSSQPENPFVQQEVNPLGKQTLYTAAPPPGSIFTFDDDDDDDDETPQLIPTGNRLRQDDDDAESDEDEEDEEKPTPKPKPPLASIPATGASGEDDEAEALAFVTKPGGVTTYKRPVKKPAGGKPSASSEDSEEESGEDDVDSEEDEEEDDDSAAAARAAAAANQRSRMYVDEDHVSFPPSRSPTLFAVIQGSSSGSPYSPSFGGQRYFSTPSGNPSRPDQRYVVRVTPARRPSPQQSLYYRPYSGAPSPSPNKRVVPIASFDVSVEDTRPGSDEESEEVVSTAPVPTQFVYKVQGQVQSLRPSGGPSGGRPPFGYYSGSGPSFIRPQSGPYGFGGPIRRPYHPSSQSRPHVGGGGYSRPPYSTSAGLFNPYAFLQQSSLSFGPPSNSHSRPRPGPPSRGPPVIVRRKPTGPGEDRPPRPQYIAVYNPTGNREDPVDEEYYTYEVPEQNGKVKVTGGSGSGPNKRPTVHRKPTPVIQQKLANEEESSEEQQAPQTVQIIPQGTVRRRGAKQLKTKKKNLKKNLTSTKSSDKAVVVSQQQARHDPLGLLSKINKSSGSKSKLH